MKLASGTHKVWISNRDKKHNEIYQKRQKVVTKTNYPFSNTFTLYIIIKTKVGTLVLIPNIIIQKGTSKKLQPIGQGRYQVMEKPTDVTYKLIDHNKKERKQHRNYLLPYWPREYALAN